MLHLPSYSIRSRFRRERTKELYKMLYEKERIETITILIE